MPRAKKADPAPQAAEAPILENAAPEPAEVTETIADDLEDIDHTGDPGVVSASPPRPHASLVSQLHIRHEELLDFVRGLEGEIEGDLGELLTLARSHLVKRAG